MAEKINIVDNVREIYDISWSLKSYSPDTYVYNKRRTPEEIKKNVFLSKRVQLAIQRASESSGQSIKDVEKEAKNILDEMGHNFQMKTIRGFAFVLTKLMKRLFKGIYVNESGIEKIRKLVPDYPILFMPTHRSYVDFLLVSYICFMFNLPLPSIAAGLDFLAMKGFHIFLRNAGAFFIRRSFGSDLLYWNIFTEYVQSQILNGDFPVEFFVEGTRSRTAKSLSPKLGFLMAALEPYFKCQISNLVIIPINITYERTLEETLYTYELLGVPKPKESTQGLVKARQILNQHYGTIHVHLDDPILLNEFCGKHKFKRISHSGPKYLSPLTNEERNICKELALYVIRKHQLNSTVTTFAIVASILLVNLQQNCCEISLEELTKDVIKVKDSLHLLGASVAWNEKNEPKDEIKESIIIHNSTIRIVSNEGITNVRVFQNDPTKLPVDLVEKSTLKGHTLQNKTVCYVTPYIFLSHYSNQLIHVFIRLSFVLVSLRSAYPNSMSQEAVFSKYKFLEQIFVNDFIFESDHTKQDFLTTLEGLRKLNLITISEDLAINNPEDKLLIIIINLIEPFLIGYKIVCQVLLDWNVEEAVSISSVVREAQAYSEKKFFENNLSHLTVFSLDLLNNALLGLINYGAVRKERKSQQNSLTCVQPMLVNVAEQLGQFIDCPLCFDVETSWNLMSKL